MTGEGQTTPEYDPEDIDRLDVHARSVLLTIARQTNVINKRDDGEGGDAALDESPAADDEEAADEPIATTRTVREATGLGRDKVNYRFRVLNGDVSNGCDPPLIETSLPSIQDDGRMPPKHLSLTPAGVAAVQDEVVDVDLAPNMPEWIRSEDVTEQIETIANYVDDLDDRIDRTIAVLDVFAKNFGFVSIEDLTEHIESGVDVPREDIFDDARETGVFALREEPIIETLAVMYQGMKATEKTLNEMDAEPSKNYTPPGEISSGEIGDESE